MTNPRPGTNFKDFELVQLSKSWLAISEDPIKGISQNKEDFWKRVWQDFKVNGGGTNRSIKSIKNKWGHVSHDVSKFCGYFTTLDFSRESGKTEDDIYLDALGMYNQLTNTEFKYTGCWNVLKYSPKWAQMSGRKDAGYSKTAATHIATKGKSTKRPTGAKKAKAKQQKEKEEKADKKIALKAATTLADES